MRLLLGLAFATFATAQEHEQAPDVGRIFTNNCASCHQQPDLRFAVDRAFVGQIDRTA